MDKYFPILEVSDDLIVSRTGDYTMAFELTKPEIFTQSTTDFEAHHQAWVRAIQSLPSNTMLHMQDWYTQMRYVPDNLPDVVGEFLANCSDWFFHERPYLKHRSYLFLTRVPEGSKGANVYSSLFTGGGLFPPATLDPRARQEFLGAVGQFERILKDSGFIQFRRLTADDLASTPEKVGLIEKYFCASVDDRPHDLEDIRFDPDFRIGDLYACLYHFADPEHLPAQCSSSMDYRRYSTDRTRFPLGFASPLGLLLPCNHIYNQYIYIGDEQATRQKLELKQRRHQSLSTHSRANALAGDAINDFLNEGIAGQRRMVKVHFNVFAWAGDPAELKAVQTMTSAAIAQMGGVPHRETITAPILWLAGVPGNAGDFPLAETFDTFAEQAACFLISETNYRSSISSFGIRLGDRLTGRPIHVDLSDEPLKSGMIQNFNKFVLGGSGSGKSFFINHLCRCYHAQGVHIVIVDIGGSYSGLTELVGGYYFQFSEDDPLRFNPFWMPTGESLDIEKKESIKTLLVVLWKKEDEAFLRSEYVALSNALQLYYGYLAAHPEIFPCFNSFYEFLQEEFVPILAKDRVKEKDFDMDNFLYVLRPFYKGGEYDYLLNAETNLDLLGQRFIVFELDVLKDHPLFPVVTIIIMEVFISKMRKLPGVRKVIVIEEAWKAIAKQGMSEYIKYIFKTVRKFSGEAIVVTQEIEDIISSPVVKQAIINNADCKILLDQSKFLHRVDQLQGFLGLPDRDSPQFLSVNRANDPRSNYKEVFISLGASISKVYRLELSLEEYLTYTTKESEKVRVKEYAKKYGGLRKGIEALAADIRVGRFKFLVIAALCLLGLLLPDTQARAQFIIGDIIGEAAKKVLIAADLAVQRLQTQTIVLQDAEKVVENAMQQTQLADIAGWVQQQKDLFAGYYQELWTIKTALSDYQRVKDMVDKQERLVAAYKQAYATIQQDPHFSAAELQHIYSVYDGILSQSSDNINQLLMVVKSFVTQMDDAGRLGIIDAAGSRIDENYNNLQQFTQENILLSMERSRDQQDLAFIKSLYGIQPAP